jgi:hypothetical protein
MTTVTSSVLEATVILNSTLVVTAFTETLWPSRPRSRPVGLPGRPMGADGVNARRVGLSGALEAMSWFVAVTDTPGAQAPPSVTFPSAVGALGEARSGRNATTRRATPNRKSSDCVLLITSDRPRFFSPVPADVNGPADISENCWGA